MQYCIYLRKSRADIDTETRGEGETLARHERILVELASRLDLCVIEIYKEVVSGETIAARPVIQRLLHEVEQGVWNGVLVMEIERLARGDTVDQGIMAQAFKYSNTKIITPIKIYDPNNEYDEEYFEFGLFMSRREYKTINRRLQRGRLASVKEGKYVGNKTPYGYTRKKLEHDKGYTLEIHSNEAEIVKLIYELYTRGEKQDDGTYIRLGAARICRRLNDLQIKPKLSDIWVPSSIRDILINPIYIGKVRWNNRPTVKKINNGEISISRPRSAYEDCVIANGLHEAIIDDETWNAVQTLMKQNPPHPTPLQYTVKNPLSGIVFCGKCGRRMVRRSNRNGSSDTLLCQTTSCGNVSSYLAIVEKHILTALQNWLIEYKVPLNTDNIKNKTNTLLTLEKKAIDKLDCEIRDVELQISNLHDLLEKGIYSADMFLERSRILAEKRKSLAGNKSKLENEIKFDNETETKKTSLLNKVELFVDIYSKSISPKAKNDLLKEVLDRIIYTKSINTRWHGDSDDFELEIYPKLPR